MRLCGCRREPERCSFVTPSPIPEPIDLCRIRPAIDENISCPVRTKVGDPHQEFPFLGLIDLDNPGCVQPLLAGTRFPIVLPDNAKLTALAFQLRDDHHSTYVIRPRRLTLELDIVVNLK